MSGLTQDLLNGIENGEHKSNNPSLLSAEMNGNQKLRSASQPQMNGSIVISSANNADNQGYGSIHQRTDTESTNIRPLGHTFCLKVCTIMFFVCLMIAFIFDAHWKSPVFDWIADIIAIVCQMILILLCFIFINEVFRVQLPPGMFTQELQNSPQVRRKFTQNQGNINRSDGDKTFGQVLWIILNDIDINIHTFSAGMCFAYYLSASMFMIQAICNTESNKSSYTRTMIRYLVNAISVPLPPILLQVFYKFTNFDYDNANDLVSNLTKKVAHKFAILSESTFQVLLLAQYFFMFATIVLNYALKYDHYIQLIQDMYICDRNECTSTPGYTMNEIILRPFVGITIINTLSILISRTCDTKPESHNMATHNHSSVKLSNLFSKINFFIFPIIIVFFILDTQYAIMDDTFFDIEFNGEWVLNGWSIVLNLFGIILAIYAYYTISKITDINGHFRNDHRTFVTRSNSLFFQQMCLLVSSTIVIFCVLLNSQNYHIHIRDVRISIIGSGLLVQTLVSFNVHKIAKWHQHFARKINLKQSINNDDKSKIDPDNSILNPTRKILISLCVLNVYNFLYQFIYVFIQFQDVWNTSNVYLVIAFGLSFTLQNWIFLNIALPLDFIVKYDKYQLKRARYISKKNNKKSNQNNNERKIMESKDNESNAESVVDDDDAKKETID